MEPLDLWIERQRVHAAAGMLMSISAVDIVKERAGFGQSLRPRRGAIVASPVPAAYDPDPDYFFHWYRDSAVVIDALRLLYAEDRIGPEALAHLADFARFSRDLQQLDGRALVAAPAWRARVTAGFTQYLRSDAELATVHGAAVAADTRVNPDGTLDISRWSRPQHDGPPLRALALLRWLGDGRAGPALDAALRAALAVLVRADLAFTAERWQTPSYDIWEEESGHHYYTLRVSAAALDEGAAWLDGQGETAPAQALRATARRILARLDDYWIDGRGVAGSAASDGGAPGDAAASAGHYRSRLLADGTRSTKELDIAVILAAIHAASPADRHASGAAAAHGPRDPRMHATLACLDALFDAEYPINRHRAAHRGPAMGRYAGDVYYSGGAYYFSTLGAAEFCYRAAAGGDAAGWRRRGDAYLETVRAYTPAGGELSEQFDRATGAQTSARHLAWSYAAFLSCVAARRGAAAG